MKITFKGRNLTIPDNDLNRIMKGLKMTKDEAISQWLEDNDYIVNEEKEALIEKTKDVKIKADPKPRTKKTVRKVDDVKKELIQLFHQTLIDNGYENVVIENDQKIITFSKGDGHFKLDLIKQRK